MGDMAGDASRLADRSLSLAAGAPSYDGQFGPQVQAIGAEAAWRLRAVSSLLTDREAFLATKADAFDAADHAVISSMGQIPSLALPAWMSFEIPKWLINLLLFILAMVPGGDLIDIIQQLYNGLRGQDIDDLVMTLAVIGLLMDLGYIDPLPLEEGGNAAAALLKVIAKNIPPGPARDALARAIKTILENPENLPKFADALGQLVKRSDLLTTLLEKHPELFARLLNEGPDAVEGMLKYSDETIVKYLDEIAGKGTGRLTLEQGLGLSDLAKRYGIDIHMAGKLADSPAESAFREALADEAAELAQKEGIPYVEAQLRVAEKYNVDFFQVKASSPGDIIKDGDVFIDADQWAKLTDTQKAEVRQAIADELGVDPQDVDFYQELTPLDPASVGVPPGKYDIPDPAHNVPEGSIHFGPDGSVDHPPLGDPDLFNQIINDLGIEPTP
jgi:hypothetical protein